MIRTIVSLTEKEKAWLDKITAEEHVSMAAVIRQAINHYKDDLEKKRKPSFQQLLNQTKGIAKSKKDGLITQKKLRSEW